MQAGQIFLVRTNPVTQFVLAQSAGVIDTANLPMPSGAQADGPGFFPGSLAAGGAAKCRCKSICIASVENCAWEVWLFATDTFNGSTTLPASVFPLGKWTFAAADGVRFGGAGLYYYFKDGLDIPYQDLDKTGELHVALTTRATSKSAGANGYVMIQFGFDLSLGI